MAKLTEYQRNYLIPFWYLAGFNTAEIAKKLNVGRKHIYSILHFKNIKIRKPLNRKIYKYNKKFFESINTPEQAYWLGFIAGDGYIIHSKGGNYQLAIILHKRDKKHLNKFKKCIDYNGKLYSYKQRAEIHISSEKIYNDLVNLSIHPNKSRIITNEAIPQYYQRHFIRGLFDADGSLSSFRTHKREQLIWRITGTQSLLLGIQQILINSLQLNKNKLLSAPNGSYILQYGGNNQTSKICDWLYQKPCAYYLDRKYKKYLEFKTDEGMD